MAIHGLTSLSIIKVYSNCKATAKVAINGSVGPGIAQTIKLFPEKLDVQYRAYSYLSPNKIVIGSNYDTYTYVSYQGTASSGVQDILVNSVPFKSKVDYSDKLSYVISLGKRGGIGYGDPPAVAVVPQFKVGTVKDSSGSKIKNGTKDVDPFIRFEIIRNASWTNDVERPVNFAANDTVTFDLLYFQDLDGTDWYVAVNLR